MFRVLAGKVETALDHQERQHYIPIASDTTNSCRLFSISWLNSLWFSDLIGAYNHHPRLYHAHHEAGLVEVIEVTVEDAIFRIHISY